MGYQSEQLCDAHLSRLARGLARRVAQEAKQKGVPTALLETVLAELAADFAPEQMIEQVWRKNLARYRGRQARAKQYRFLQYRGFSASEINRLYDRLQEYL